MDYGDVVYDQPSNDAFFKKTQNCPVKCSFSNYGSNKRYISQKIVLRLRLEYLQQIRCIKRLCLFCKVVSTKISSYIYDIILPVRQSQRHPNRWNKLNHGISSSGPFLFDQVQVRFIISVIRSALSW